MKLGFILFGGFLLMLISYACGHDVGESNCECVHRGGHWYADKCITEIK